MAATRISELTSIDASSLEGPAWVVEVGKGIAAPVRRATRFSDVFSVEDAAAIREMASVARGVVSSDALQRAMRVAQRLEQLLRVLS